MDRSQLLNKMDRAWEGLKEAYQGLSADVMVLPGAMDDWSVKDIIAHVTWWEEEALTHLPSIMDREKLPRYSDQYGGINAFNAHMFESKRDLPLETVLRERVGPERYQESLAEPHASEFDMTGRPMTGWVVVTPEGYRADKDFQSWVQRGVNFASSLPAK